MKKYKLLIVTLLLSAISSLLFSCAGHPKGLDEPKQLTDYEKNRTFEIALNTPEVQRQLQKEAHYTTELDWLAVIWNGSEWSAYYHINEEWEIDPNLSNVPDSAVFYPYVTIRFGEPATWQITVAVDLETGIVALIHEYPAGKGPSQSAN